MQKNRKKKQMSRNNGTVYFKRVEGNEGNKCHYPTRLDTYGCGCQHDCKYCYAKSLLAFRGHWNPNNPQKSDIEQIKKIIKTLPKDEVVRLGGMTDCFMPMEKTERVTYETIKALNNARIEYLIVTKSSLVADDEYIEILDKDLAHIQITVTTLEDNVSQVYEKASLPSERINAILKLQEAGFDVAIRISPFIPQLMDTKKLATLGINKAIVEFLRANGFIKRWFKVNWKEYSRYEGGYHHLPLARKIRYIEQIKGFKQVSVCEDVDTDYLYWKQYFNPNPDDCCNLRRYNDTKKADTRPVVE